MFIRSLIRKVKLLYTRRIFQKSSIYGVNLGLSTNTRCFVTKKEQLIIGDNCDLAGCRIYAVSNGRVIIGNNTTIRYNTKISAVNEVNIGSHVIISNNVNIYDHNSHPTSPKKRWEMCDNGFYGDAWSPRHSSSKKVIIEDGVWIGEKSTILKGITIGRGSIVASNSVVSKDVPCFSIVAGNPAKVVKKLNERG